MIKKKRNFIFVDLVPQDNNKHIYNISSLCCRKIKIEPLRKKKMLQRRFSVGVFRPRGLL